MLTPCDCENLCLAAPADVSYDDVADSLTVEVAAHLLLDRAVIDVAEDLDVLADGRLSGTASLRRRELARELTVVPLASNDRRFVYLQN